MWYEAASGRAVRVACAGNDILVAGAKAIAETLSKNKTLTWLGLCGQ
jgi:hypothetical protein